MSLYVAGSSAEVDLIADYMAKLRVRGVAISFDWTSGVIANRASGKPDAELTSEERYKYAYADILGVSRADTLWLLAPSTSSTGVWVEFGYAIAERKTVIVSGPWRRCIFAELADHKFDTHAEAFAWLTSERAEAALRERDGLESSHG